MNADEYESGQHARPAEWSPGPEGKSGLPEPHTGMSTQPSSLGLLIQTRHSDTLLVNWLWHCIYSYRLGTLSPLNSKLVPLR